ncbi:14597_t:CDS:1, partial [Gigaspora margarita]
ISLVIEQLEKSQPDKWFYMRNYILEVNNKVVLLSSSSLE